MSTTYATLTDRQLLAVAAHDNAAHDAYSARMAYRDAIRHALTESAVWDEISASNDAYSDPEATGPIATAELSALLAPIGRV